MSGADAEEVVMELKRVEVGAKVREYVEKYASELEVDENSGKVRVLATGIEFGSTKGDAAANDAPLLAALVKYHTGKKYKLAVAAAKAMQLAASYDFLVPHKFHKKWLFCSVCKKQVNPYVEDILNHVESKKCRREREAKAQRRGGAVEEEEEVASGSEDEDGAGSDEDVFFDYTGGAASDSEEEGGEEEEEAEETAAPPAKKTEKVAGKKRKTRAAEEGSGNADWRLRKKRKKNANK